MEPAYDLEMVRSQLPVLREWTYLNTGTVGVMAEPVLAIHLDNIADHERFGHATQPRAVQGYERARERLAKLLNASPDAIGLNRNATDGINWVAATFPLRPGDEVITSVEEHPAMILPWLAACQRSGASLRYIPLSADSDAFAASVYDALSERTRIVAISHVSCETGLRVPVEALRSIVGDDTAILVDASQSVGQFPIDIENLNADFVIGNGHKWLAGPKGTGFAWINPSRIDLIPPTYFGDGAVDPRWSRAHYQVHPPPSVAFSGNASRFEFGTRAWHTYGALADAIDYQEDLGWGAICNHVARLSEYAKQELAEIPGVTVITPPDWNDSSGIVSFTIAGMYGKEVSRRLWDEERITQRSVESPSAVRVSVTYFTSKEDITRLAHAVDRLSRGH